MQPHPCLHRSYFRTKHSATKVFEMLHSCLILTDEVHVLLNLKLKSENIVQVCFSSSRFWLMVHFEGSHRSRGFFFDPFFCSSYLFLIGTSQNPSDTFALSLPSIQYGLSGWQAFRWIKKIEGTKIHIVFWYLFLSFVFFSF